jgi:tungstate transport system substrate-binding protein
MGRVLQMAGELDAYTLTDRGTWLAYAGQSPLRIVSEGDSRLFNPYSIIAVNPKRYADINHAGAQALIDWLVSPAGQRLIGDFRIHGKRLFTPSASGK